MSPDEHPEDWKVCEDMWNGIYPDDEKETDNE